MKIKGGVNAVGAWLAENDLYREAQHNLLAKGDVSRE